MPKLPRDLNGADLARKLIKIGYRQVRQTGSHIRLTKEGKEEHHLTIPAHSPLKVGTLNGILSEVASFSGIKKEDLIQILFD